MAALIHFTFINGIGSIVATLHRNENQIGIRGIKVSGSIFFDDTQANDKISIKGACAGSVVVEIDLPTVPVTPKEYPAGKIHDVFLITG